MEGGLLDAAATGGGGGDHGDDAACAGGGGTGREGASRSDRQDAGTTGTGQDSKLDGVGEEFTHAFVTNDASTIINEQASKEDRVSEESTRAFIIKVKKEMERCLEAGMSKEQMFEEFCHKKLAPAPTFAVYIELRRQNPGFFRDYFIKMDVEKQAELFQSLMDNYSTALAPPTATTATPADVDTSPISSITNNRELNVS